MRYKGAHKDVARIGRELRVDYILEGGVRRKGDRIILTVQLIRVSDQTHVFARRYDADVHNVFEMRPSSRKRSHPTLKLARGSLETDRLLPSLPW